jgi:hypothetical protein
MMRLIPADTEAQDPPPQRRAMSRIRWTASTYAAAIAAVCLAAAPAAAQRATLRGQVVDSRSGQPVPNAAVFVDDSRTGVYADAQGRFEVRHLRAGTRAIWAESPGYKMDLSMVEVAAPATQVTLQMEGNPVQLEALRVTTNRLDRRARGYAGTSRVFRESDLATMWYSNVQQLVQSRGAVRATSCRNRGSYGGAYGSLGYRGAASYTGGGCVYSRGTTYSARVFIDEMPWVAGVESLSDFPLAEVARVEIYGQGREVHVFTRQFMNWLSQRPYVPTPIGLGA